ncbi:MAG: 4a-hydroxytetrahydrobiopterin dehydratase [Actinobacteria bacterium]|nr:MAG: 4a-hydroxytetrahydrobiopterin dehydratase [Actinomycetota bacterium]
MPSDLSADQIHSFLGEHRSWTTDGESITRTFVFRDFNEALGFVVRIGAASEVADHHPDINIRWNKVTCVLSTHSEGALTSKDLELAATFDQIAG